MAAAVLRALDVSSTHVAGFSGGSIIAQELGVSMNVTAGQAVYKRAEV